VDRKESGEDMKTHPNDILKEMGTRMMKIKVTGVPIIKEDALILCFPKKMSSDSVNIASSSFSQYFRIEINEISNIFLFQT
jgi:hypothetical protein